MFDSLLGSIPGFGGGGQVRLDRGLTLLTEVKAQTVKTQSPMVVEVWVAMDHSS